MRLRTLSIGGVALLLAISLALTVGTTPVRAATPCTGPPFTSTDGSYKFAGSYSINTGFAGAFDGDTICHFNVTDGTTYSGIIVTVNSPITAITDGFTGDYFVSLQGSGWPSYISQTILASHAASASDFSFPSFSITPDSTACETANMKVGRYKSDGSVADGDLAFILEAPPCVAVPEFTLPIPVLMAGLAPIVFLFRRRTR